MDANCGRYHYSNVSVVVMIDRAHRKHSLTNKECRLAMGKLLHRLGQGETSSTHSFDLLFVRSRFSLRGLLFLGSSFHKLNYEVPAMLFSGSQARGCFQRDRKKMPSILLRRRCRRSPRRLEKSNVGLR